MRSRRRSSTRKREELSDSSGETGLVTKTQAACGPACKSPGGGSQVAADGSVAKVINCTRSVSRPTTCEVRPQPVQDEGGSSKPAACRDARACRRPDKACAIGERNLARTGRELA